MIRTHKKIGEVGFSFLTRRRGVGLLPVGGAALFFITKKDRKCPMAITNL